jgi:hypothetical protein
MMDHVVSRWETVVAYMDNSWVGSPDRQTHLVHLEALFAALAANGLATNLEKCVFAIPTLEILGHAISAAGSTPTAGHTAAIDTSPALRTSNNRNVFSA